MIEIIVLFSIFVILVIFLFIETKNVNIVKVKKNEIASFKTTMDLVGLPIMTFYYGKEKYHFLIDSGSNFSYLNTDCSLPKVTRPVSADSIYGSSGEPQEYSSEADAIICYNNKEYSCTFKIANFAKAFDKMKDKVGITLSGILGTDFLEKYKYCIDFKELAMYARK